MRNISMQIHVISVWLQNPWAGLGDLIRGTMHLCDLSQRLNFKLTIDTQFHPISKFLTASEHSEQSDYVLQNKNKVHDFVNGDIKKLLHVIVNAMHHAETDPILISSNITESMFVAPNDKTSLFIRNFLSPTHEFKTTLNRIYGKHQINKNYSIIHCRLGDEDLVNHHMNRSTYRSLLNVIDSNVTENSYIISDSYGFKQFLREARPHLASKVITTKPIHLSHSTEKDTDKVMDTMFDFYLLMNAKMIKTYTTYTWVSGFVKWVSLAFGVPLININVQKSTHQQDMYMYNQQMQSQFTFSKTPMMKMRTDVRPMLFLNK